MKLPLDRYVETGDPIVLPLNSGSWAGRKVAIDLETCGDPTCGCAKIDFYCRPFAGDTLPADDTPAIVFALDVWDRCVADPETGDLTHEARSLGKAVMGELDEQDWHNLLEYLTMVKREMLKTTDVSTIDVSFPTEVMDGDDSKVGYCEIFPYAELSAFELGNWHWGVDDQHFVDPDDDSSEVLLTFLGTPIEPSAKPPATNDSMPMIIYNYMHGEVETVEVEPVAGQPAIAELLRAAKAECPLFDQEIMNRHHQIRTLFWKAVLREEAETVPVKREAPKIGRNDPCPCGSGEKYKKCCGIHAAGSEED